MTAHLHGLVIDRRLKGAGVGAFTAMVRLYQGDRVLGDVQVRDPDGWLRVGVRLTVPLTEVSDGTS